MSLLYLSWKNCFAKPLTFLLTWVLLALGVGLMVFLCLINYHLEQQFDRNLAGIDLVVGAKGSPLQLILSGIYHIDNPTGNIKLRDAAFLMRNPNISQTIPQALGDSYEGFRVCGTNHAYAKLYKTRLQKESKLWDKDFEVTIGSTVAAQCGLKVGSELVSSHGLTLEDENKHAEHPYKVVGIFEPNGSVIDQIILTSISSVWQMHQHNEAPKGAPQADSLQTADDLDREITSLLVFYKDKTSLTALNLPRLINQNTPLQAGSPVMETHRLYDLVGNGTLLLRWISYLIAAVSALSVFIALLGALHDRRYELALMRTMGASRRTLFTGILLEGFIIASLGTVGGFVLGHAGAQIAGYFIQKTWHYSLNGAVFLKIEPYIAAFALLLGVVAAFIPAVKAARTDVIANLKR